GPRVAAPGRPPRRAAEQRRVVRRPVVAAVEEAARRRVAVAAVAVPVAHDVRAAAVEQAALRPVASGATSGVEPRSVGDPVADDTRPDVRAHARTGRLLTALQARTAAGARSTIGDLLDRRRRSTAGDAVAVAGPVRPHGRRRALGIGA